MNYFYDVVAGEINDDDWMYNFDNLTHWLDKLHREQRDEEETWLQYASWLIPGGELGELLASEGAIKAGLKLFAIKRGRSAIVSGLADVTTQMVNGKGNLANRLENVNVISTIASSVLEHPLTVSSFAASFNVSIFTVHNGGILQISDPNLGKSIILGRSAALGGQGFFKEAASGIIAGQIDQHTNKKQE